VTVLDITALAHGGDGVARLEDGRVAFVRDACPGDRLRVEILQEKDRFVRARSVEVLEPSPDRVEPPCPYFERCGGCQWQHVSYDAQLSAKRSSVSDALTRIGGQDPGRILEPIASPAEYGYRNKIELTVGWDAEAGPGRGMSLCYSERGSDELVPVESCLLLPERWTGAPRALTGAMRYLWGRDGLPVQRVGLRVSERTGDVELDLWGPPGAFPRGSVARVLQDAVDARTVARVLVRDDAKRRRIRGTEVLAGRGYWSELLASLSFTVSAPSFFQVNTAAADNLVAAVLGAIDGREGLVLDAFAGVGTFSLPAALQGHEVIAVEREKSALHDLARNLEAADAAAHVIPGDVAYALDELEPVDTAVLDPPRTGLSPEALTAIASLEPGRIVYVACDPATLARDVKRFGESGYALVTAEPVDLFPQTYHVETVAVLDLR
jgi:23S rRNA (uracil1939-C5)-methyltransferase